MSRWPVLDRPTPIAFAHRGGTSDAPENTMPAFAAAAALGYTFMETDAHVTRDGVVVAFHDDELDRVSDGSGAIAELDWPTVSRARVGGSESVPLLEDLIGSFPDVSFNIDPKHDEVVEPLVRVIQRTGSIDRVLIGSFSERRLVEIRERLGPRICTSAGSRIVALFRAQTFKIPGPLPPIGALQVPTEVRGTTLVDQRFVDTAHDRDLQVHVWTIDDPAEMHRLLDLGVDGIMTDEPAVLRAVLEARGVWHRSL